MARLNPDLHTPPPQQRTLSPAEDDLCDLSSDMPNLHNSYRPHSPKLASPAPKTPVHHQSWLVDENHNFAASPVSISHRLEQMALSESTDSSGFPSIQEESSEDSDSEPPETSSTPPHLHLHPLKIDPSLSSPLEKPAMFVYHSTHSRFGGTTPEPMLGLEPVLEMDSPTRHSPMSPSPVTTPLGLRDMILNHSPPSGMFRRGPPSPSPFQMRFQSRSTPPPFSASLNSLSRKSLVISPTPSRYRTPPPVWSASSPPVSAEASPNLTSRFNEPFALRRTLSLNTTPSSSASQSYASSPYLRPYSMPNTPTSVRSRSPSLSSLETIPDTPDAEAEALQKEQEEAKTHRSRGGISLDTLSIRNTDRFRRRGRRGTGDTDIYGRYRKPSWDASPTGLAGTRDKRKRWSVCGGERRADLDLETIWED